MKAMIFAAGLGTRLKPLTNTKPKALVEAEGKTLLQLNIERLIDFGIVDIVINVHHFADQVIDYLKSKNNFNINITISDERDNLLDTGGGLRKAAHLLAGNDPILIQNVDIYTNIDYGKLLEQHTISKSMATLAIQKRKSSRYLLFNSEFQLCGWRNTTTEEKIITQSNFTTEDFAFSGVHMISPQVLHQLPKKDIFGIIEVYLELSKNQQITGYLHNNDDWFDIGTVEKLEKLSVYLKANNRTLHP